MRAWFDKHLRLINRCLLAIIIACNGYVLLSPLMPAVSYQVKTHTSKPLNPAKPDELAKLDRSKNQLVIPRLRLQEPILDGASVYTVNQGIWRRPNTSTPDRGSNTVLVGHRFTYSGAAVFYNLDKVVVDDPIISVWEGKIYVYKVRAVEVLPPEATYVEAASNDERLTLYTCTPMWSAKQRLVVTAKLERVVL